jgi:N-acetylneuraminate synthase/sialic acid synthase
MRMMRISDTDISDLSKCFVIAEIGHNHQGNLELAKKLIRSAGEAGVSAVKFQKRDNKSLFTPDFYDRPYNSENSFGATYGEHRENLEFNREQYVDLKNYAESLGLVFFATAFDFRSADLLAGLEMPAFKVASGDLTNIPLIKHLSKFGKPLLISTGGGHIADLHRVKQELDGTGTPYSFLQCTAGYPPAWNEINLKVIQTYRELFPEIVIGFSSHDNGIAMAAAAYALGARIIEKHFTLDRTLKGTDHAFSLEPQGLRKLVRDLDRLHLAMGDGSKKRYESESVPLEKMGKKIVLSKNVNTGDYLDETCFEFRSPGDGLSPWQVTNLIGKRVKNDMTAGSSVSLSDFQ